MRRNLRLDWRALALLGALLTIMIKWPGEAGGMGLVHAMPTNMATRRSVEPTIMTLLNMEKNVTAIQSLHNNVDINAIDKHNETTPTMLLLLPTISDEMSTTAATINEPSADYIHENYENINHNGKSDTNNNTYNYTNNKIVHNIHASGVNRSTTTIATNKITEVNEQNLQNNSQHIKITNLVSNKIKHKSIDNEALTENYSISNELNRNSNHIIIQNNNNNNNVSKLSVKQVADKENSNKEAIYDEYEEVKGVMKIEKQFKFTSNNHITILSRTERSVYDDDVGDNVSYIVRRSPQITHVGNIRGGLKSKRLNSSRNQQHNNSNNLDRNERSTISHLSGPSRKIQLFIKNRYLQLLPDGTVNGTQDHLSEYIILQRSTVDVGRIKIQSVATCLYVCMDACGNVFGSKDFSDDCIFNENMEEHNYNTYSSTYNSNARRTFYLALNRHGEPRKLQIPPTRSLGKLATYTNAITETVSEDRVEQLIAKNFGENRVKHGIRQLCDTGKPLIELIDRHNFKARPMCNPNSSNSSSSNTNKNSSKDSSISNSHITNNVPAANDKIKTNIDINSNAHKNNNNSLNNRQNEPANIHHNNRHHHQHQHHHQTHHPHNSSSSSSSNRSDNHNSSRNSTSSNSSEVVSNSASSISKSQNISGHISNSSSNSSSSGLANQQANAAEKKKNKKKRRKCRPHENEEQHNCHRGPLALKKRKQNNKNNKNKLPKCKDLVLINGEATVPCSGSKKNGPKKLKKTADLASNKRGKKQNLGNGQNKKNKKNKNQNKRNGKNKKPQDRVRNLNDSLTTSTTLRNLEKTTPRILFTTNIAALESTTIYDDVEKQRLESTTMLEHNDRGERELRNVPTQITMHATIDSTEINDDNVSEENSNSAEDDKDAEHTEDDETENSSSYEEMQAQLTAGAEDVLYYDQLDFTPMALWQLVALFWILPRFLQLSVQRIK